MKRPTAVRLRSGTFLVNGTLEIEPPDPPPVPLPPTFGRMKGADGEVVDVAIFENGFIVERAPTAREALATLNQRALKRCGGHLDEFRAAWNIELGLDEYLKNIAAR